MNILVNKRSFGKNFDFDSYDLEIYKRENFLPIPNHLKLTSYPSKFFKLGDSIDSLKLSKHYSDVELITKPLQVTLLSDEEVDQKSGYKGHAFEIDFLYRNLQRMCLEILDPIFELNGTKPVIESALLYKSSIDNDADSFFSDQIKGNAVVFNYKNDQYDEKFERAYSYIKEFSVFDRIYVDKTNKKYDRPTLMVSVNEKKRRILEAVRRD